MGRVGDDPTGDALLLALSLAGVGHAAVLRDPSRGTPLFDGSIDGADVVAPDDDDDPMPRAEEATPDPRLPVLEAADLELGLRYVPDYHVLVVAHPVAGAALRTVDDAASYAGAHLVLLTIDPDAGEGLATRSTTVLAVPADDDGAFAQVVATYAVRLDSAQRRPTRSARRSDRPAGRQRRSIDRLYVASHARVTSFVTVSKGSRSEDAGHAARRADHHRSTAPVPSGDFAS